MEEDPPPLEVLVDLSCYKLSSRHATEKEEKGRKASSPVMRHSQSEGCLWLVVAAFGSADYVLFVFLAFQGLVGAFALLEKPFVEGHSSVQATKCFPRRFYKHWDTCYSGFQNTCRGVLRPNPCQNQPLISKSLFHKSKQLFLVIVPKNPTFAVK